MNDTILIGTPDTPNSQQWAKFQEEVHERRTKWLIENSTIKFKDELPIGDNGKWKILRDKTFEKLKDKNERRIYNNRFI